MRHWSLVIRDGLLSLARIFHTPHETVTDWSAGLRPALGSASRKSRSQTGAASNGYEISGLAGVLLALLALTPSARAHQLSDSFLILQVTNSEIIGHWDIALRDLQHARGLDPLDQKFTDLRSFDAEREMTNAHVLSRLRMKIDGIPADIKPIDYSREIYNDGPYAAVYFGVPLLKKEPRILEIEYRLFFESDNVHRGLMRLQVGGKTVSAIFSPAKPIQRFRLRAVGALENIFDFMREGVRAHLGWD